MAYQPPNQQGFAGQAPYGYQGGGAPQYGAPQQAYEQGAPPGQQPYGAQQGQPQQDQSFFPQAGQLGAGGDMHQLNTQMGAMNMDGQPGGRGTMRKKGRHAYHDVGTASGGAPPMPAAGGQWAPPGGQQWDQNAQAQPGFQGYQNQQQWSQPGTPGVGVQSFQQQHPQQPMRAGTPLQGQPITSAQGKVDPEQVPSIPWSRDAPAEYYLENVYPTMEQHLPPPACVPFVAVDQSNSSPKYCRLTLNNIPTTSEALNSTSIPLGLILQPLAPQQDGEQPVPVVDFGDQGPPRCRRCRTYINPFMVFRSGGNKFVCNMCTFPNDVDPAYFAPTDPSGTRVDRTQRPELSMGTIEFAAPREYWTKDPVPQRWLFLIDVSMESVSKGFLECFCQGVLEALYGKSHNQETDGDVNGAADVPKMATGSQVGFATFDKEAHFYTFAPESEHSSMYVMPDIEEPFLPTAGNTFVNPYEFRTAITNLLNKLPAMFSRIKHPEPALLPALNAALESLKPTGGRLITSLASLPTWGPGRLFMREKPELRDTDGERKVFATEHPGFHKAAKNMTEAGIGADFFLAAPQGGYLDIATIGHVSEKTGGEVYYYPNYVYPRDNARIAKELSRNLTRESGFQALLKVRCSNGLQVSNYFGNFTQHTFGADIELGSIDADKSFGASFSYDGKLDPKLDAHFQSALLYTTADGHRRIRCTNTVASVSEGALAAMKLVDQDAVVSLFAKQAAHQMPDKILKDIRARITEKTIDILSSYRRNFSGSHPPGQLVLPENLKEFALYALCLLKTRALKGGIEPADRRVYDMRSIKALTPAELSLHLYPRMIALHNLDPADGFPNERGHLKLPASMRLSWGRVEEGGAYLVDPATGPVILWLHTQVSPNLLEDLLGPAVTGLEAVDPYLSELPVLETHLNAQVRNVLQFMGDARGSKGCVLQIARQGMDGSEFEFARSLMEDRNSEERSYVDWLVAVHRGVQLEVS
ncbi:MAG: hypothetical protein Q9162_004300 [Coniocarpon cinnabarinum]